MQALDPHIVSLIAATCGVGYLMTYCGLQKNALERKKRRRICPSCGHDTPRCVCT
jgi:hypothetical protein